MKRPHNMANPQIAAVFRAYLAGCRTTSEVHEFTGLPKMRCCSRTLDLVRIGRLKVAGLAERRARGQRPYFYEPS